MFSYKLYHILGLLTIVGNGANSEHLARIKPFLVFGLEKRSGHPEQLAKMGEKYDLIRRNRPFLGHLDEFGEIWILIWIKC